MSFGTDWNSKFKPVRFKPLCCLELNNWTRAWLRKGNAKLPGHSEQKTVHFYTHSIRGRGSGGGRGEDGMRPQDIGWGGRLAVWQEGSRTKRLQSKCAWAVGNHKRAWLRLARCEKELQLQLQFVYSISIINELLGIFVAYAGRGAKESPCWMKEWRNGAGKEQSQLPSNAEFRLWLSLSCRCENLMYKYNLPHTQTLMWPPKATLPAGGMEYP